jgi:hypothetical protein
MSVNASGIFVTGYSLQDGTSRILTVKFDR